MQDSTLIIRNIRRDGGTQSRAELDPSVLAEYRDIMLGGVDLPAVTVYYDGNDYWLADGFHRVEAAIDAGRNWINAQVHQGTQRHAILASVGANAQHGLRRSNADKRRAVKTMLSDDEWRGWSNSQIARQCGVDDKTVGNIRREMEVTSEIPKSDTRIGADGRNVAVGNIGAVSSPSGWREELRAITDKYRKAIFIFEDTYIVFDVFYEGSRLQVVSNDTMIDDQSIRFWKFDAGFGELLVKKLGHVAISLVSSSNPQLKGVLKKLNQSLGTTNTIASSGFSDKSGFDIGDQVVVDGLRTGTIRYIKETKVGVYMDTSHTTHDFDFARVMKNQGSAARPIPEDAVIEQLTIDPAMEMHVSDQPPAHEFDIGLRVLVRDRPGTIHNLTDVSAGVLFDDTQFVHQIEFNRIAKNDGSAARSTPKEGTESFEVDMLVVTRTGRIGIVTSIAGRLVTIDGSRQHYKETLRRASKEEYADFKGATANELAEHFEGATDDDQADVWTHLQAIEEIIKGEGWDAAGFFEANDPINRIFDHFSMLKQLLQKSALPV